MRKIISLYRVTSIVEFLTILWHHFLTKKLSTAHPDLHRVLVFLVKCDNNDITVKKEKENLLLSWQEPGCGLAQCYVRKYSRDLLVFNDFFIQRDYDQFVQKLNKKNSSEFQLIIDAGANIGCAALYFHFHFPKAKIICIEPELSNFKMLLKNIAPLPQITALQKALWSERTELELMQRGWSEDGFLVMHGHWMQSEVVDKVKTVTIIDLLTENGGKNIDVLKMDIEGAEKEVLANFEQVKYFLPKINSLVMEVHEEFISAEEVITLLKNFSFNCDRVSITGQPVAIFADKDL